MFEIRLVFPNRELCKENRVLFGSKNCERHERLSELQHDEVQVSLGEAVVLRLDQEAKLVHKKLNDTNVRSADFALIESVTSTLLTIGTKKSRIRMMLRK